MNKVRLCMIFTYCDCTYEYNYATFEVPEYIAEEDVKKAIEEVHKKFDDWEEDYAKRMEQLNNEGYKDGEVMFIIACEENNWIYSSYSYFCTVDVKKPSGGYGWYTANELAEIKAIEPVSLEFEIYNGG